MKKSLLILVFLIISYPVFSQWSNDPLVNNPVSTSSGDQRFVESCPDGAGGLIMAWVDYRTNPPQIYSQKINAFGQSVWQLNGVPAALNAADQTNPAICSDAAGGCIITWIDSRNGSNGDMYAQRIRTDGLLMWNSAGVRVSRASSYLGIDLNQVKIIQAEGGYAIISWRDIPTSSLLTQKLSDNGTRLWDANDVVVTNAVNHYSMCKDSQDGIYFAYMSEYPAFIYTQHLNINGVAQWPGNTLIVSVPSYKYTPTMCEDQNGGFIVSWPDWRDNPFTLRPNIYASHIGPSHNDIWTPNGTSITTGSANNYQLPKCISDNHGGAYIVYLFSDPTFTDFRVYAQDISYFGDLRWTPANGKLITDKVDYIPTLDNRFDVQMATVDALGGLITCWLGYYDNALTQYGLLAQRMDYYGNNIWDNNGVFVSKGTNMLRPTIVFDGGSSGCNIAWSDSRNFGSSGFDIYAQHLKANSNLGNRINNNSVKGNFVKQNYPNPFNPETSISFNISQPGFVSLNIYDMSGREVASLVNSHYDIGEYSVTWKANNFASGVYYYKFISNNRVEVKSMILVK
ncbi:hypothetical protein BH10BAC5_BH10BAC5_25880 [soil metagenome]